MSRLEKFDELYEEIKQLVAFYNVYPDGEEILQDLKELVKRYG